MNKRILSLVLALVMVLGTFAVVSAEEVKAPENMTQANKIQWLVDNKIVEGHKINEDETELDLEGSLTREQASKLLVHLIDRTKLAENLQGSMKLFSDVDYDRWSNGVINVLATYTNDVNNQVIVMGYPDGTFQPANDVTYAELATMLVRVVKDNLTEDDVKYANDHWATQWMRWAAEEGILKGIDAKNYNEAVSRRDAFEMIYNTQYRLGKVNFNKVDFGDKMGIISKLAAGKVEINQDSKMTYNITYNTVFTDGTTINSLAQNAARPGSLVRLITDKDNNVLYMIELGNPRVGAIDGRWTTVANETVSAMKKDDYAVANFGTAEFDGRNKINFYNENGTTKAVVDILTSTKVFVADVNNNFLKQVNSVADAMNYFGYNSVDKIWENKAIDNVYAGYDITKWGNEARVIVFNKTHKSNTDGQLLRVKTPGVNSQHNVALENTKGEVITSNTANWFPTNWFPGNIRFNFMDVVTFETVKESNNLYTRPEVVISYANNDVYGVDSINRANRTITLVDVNNRKETFILAPGFDEFLEGQLESMNVQISTVKDANKKDDMSKGYRIIDVISNVKDARRGYLNATVEPKQVVGTVLGVEMQAGIKYVTVDVKDANYNGGKPVVYRSILNENPEVGKEYTFTLTENIVGNDTYVITKFEKTAAQLEKDKKAADVEEGKALVTGYTTTPAETHISVNVQFANDEAGKKIFELVDGGTGKKVQGNNQIGKFKVITKFVGVATPIENVFVKSVNDDNDGNKFSEIGDSISSPYKWDAEGKLSAEKYAAAWNSWKPANGFGESIKGKEIEKVTVQFEYKGQTITKEFTKKN